MTKRITKIRYKVYIIRDNELYERKYSTADEIVDDLSDYGLSRDIIYRKIKATSGRGHAYTGYRKCPHRCVKIFKVSPPVPWTPWDKLEHIVGASG